MVSRLKRLVVWWTPPIMLRAYGSVRGLRSKPAGETGGLRPLGLETLFAGIQGAEVRLNMAHMESAAGTLPLRECVTLGAICQHLQPRLVFEIGTFRGSSTLLMAMNSAPDCQIYTLDLPPGEVTTKYDVDNGNITGMTFSIGEHFERSAYATRIQQLYGDSAAFDFSPFAGSIDLVFVDGSHSYENVVEDSQTAFAMLRPGGVILWDDYHPEWGPGVMRALHELGQRRLYRIMDTRFAIYVGPSIPIPNLQPQR